MAFNRRRPYDLIDWVLESATNASNVQLLFDRIFITGVYTTQSILWYYFHSLAGRKSHNRWKLCQEKGCINFQPSWKCLRRGYWGRRRNVPKARCSTALLHTKMESVSCWGSDCFLFFFFRIHSFAYSYGNLNMRRLVVMDDIREYTVRSYPFSFWRCYRRIWNLNAYFLFAGFF